jgi:hypothetical protein
MAARSDGARQWMAVLSELAATPVTVEWERPAWRVRWVDGPTRSVLMDRAVALGRYRVGGPLPASDLSFSRRSSPLALALAWLRVGAGASQGDAFVRAEQFAEDTGYPQERFDAPDLAAAELLAQLAGGESRVMGKLLANAYPAVPPLRPVRTMPDLKGRVVSIRWPIDGPPADLLGPTEPTTRAGSGDQTRRCEYCGAALPPQRLGRSRLYCSDAHRVAAHRARRRGDRQQTAEPA